MSDKKSSFDLQSDMKSYLISLHHKGLNFVKSCIYVPIEHQRDDIVYIRNRHDLVTGIHEGLDSIYTMQKNKIKEQKTLRANSKNYIKKYYADGILNEIECFVEGKFDCRFIAVYDENKRYLIPFTETGAYYPTYSHILEKHENYYEEYMIDDVQIVYRKYTQQTDKNYAYLYINYVPQGSYPICALETGTFVINEQISYLQAQHYDWYAEFDAKRKNAPFLLCDIPFMIKSNT